MTRFEEIGADLQGRCINIEEAVRTMHYSCTLCASRNVRVRCDQCAIAIAHEQVCTLLMDAATEAYDQAMKRLRCKRKSSRQASERVCSYNGHVTHVCHYD